MLTVANLSKAYPTPLGPLQILDDISFSLQAGVFMAIIGESGSGKSTLLQLLGTLDQADSGEIHLGEIAIHALKEQDLAMLRNRDIGFVYQSHHLIPELTALENIMLPLLIQGKNKTYAKEKALDLLGLLGLSERASHIPAHLSGGEAQRVAVARAIITQPKLLLADEPTGNLDEATAHTVFNMIKDTCKAYKIATIMVTHSKSFANACDEVYELSHHKLQIVKSKKS
ncbi:ABC transporter ATP-binding protein [Ghiorsea bivora]|uniref:ABC transporter ATP-binding protein n=1 Tax=Ghiorsea bivora TaxID=1485545 RepID=UPI000570302A|nr:ABC transporter ATP-binding protein [Ghiorsea bivora]